MDTKDITTLLVQHNTESFDNFITKNIPSIINNEKNIVHILKNKENTSYQTTIKFTFSCDSSNIKLDRVKKIKPNECRLSGSTYQGKLQIKLSVEIVHKGARRFIPKDKDDNIQIDLKIPIMLHSKFCCLKNKSNELLSSYGESPYERGGYFIIKGLEKIILSQEDTAINIINTRIESETKNIIATIKSQFGSNASEKFQLTYEIKTQTIYATIPYLKGDIPLIILFRALGLESERDILYSICGSDLSSEIANLLCRQFEPTIEAVENIYDQETALKCISLLTKNEADEKNNNNKWKSYLLYILNSRFLPHINDISDDCMENLNNKSAFLGYMTRTLLLTQLKIKPISDRDNMIFKRVRLPGEILTDMFRDFYELYLKKVKNDTDKLIQHSMQKAGNDNIDKINEIIENKLTELTSMTELQKNIDKSFMGKFGVNPTHPKNEGVLQSYLRHSYMECMSHLRRVHLHINTSSPNTMAQRRLHNSQYGYYCPIETPDGPSIGQHKHLAHTCTISSDNDPTLLLKWIHDKKNVKHFVKLNDSTERYTKNINHVFVNGDLIGIITNNADEFVKKLLLKRQNIKDKDVNWDVSISWIIQDLEIRIFTNSGRLIRPLLSKILTKNNNINIANRLNEIQKKNIIVLDPIDLCELDCEFIDPNEADNILISIGGSTQNTQNINKYSHFEIIKTASLGLTALTLPFLEHNPIARNLYACQQSRQAVSVYASNFNFRMDQMSSLLHYGQKPILNTGVVNKLNNNNAPYGCNINVCIAAINGYNQEDAIIINKSAIENGLFASSYHTTYSLREEGITNTPGEVKIINPKFSSKEILNLNKNWNYDSLDENGIIKKNTKIQDNTVLIGAFVINQQGQAIDNSLIAKHAHLGEIVDRVYISQYYPRIAKVLVRHVRFPIVGDKFASRQAQKATIGLICEKENMPYTKDGLTPDIIFNPHSFPSRMTIAYLLEMLTTEIGLQTGRLIEIQNFNAIEYSYDTFTNILKKINGNFQCEYPLYSGTSGKLICEDACIGTIFYQRLKQMVSDKIYARGMFAPRDNITRQPLHGRSKNGGLRIGTMETDCLLSHGISQFTKEIFWDKSNVFEMPIDKVTGQVIPHNPEKNVFHNSDYCYVQTPYAFKLLLDELRSMGISTKIRVDN
tara:strand:+ start:543 stop:3983 length:3441 start_codon:yes stop_codon:yes gene_type:complete